MYKDGQSCACISCFTSNISSGVSFWDITPYQTFQVEYHSEILLHTNLKEDFGPSHLIVHAREDSFTDFGRRSSAVFLVGGANAFT